ncbi:MAG: asparagine synthase (glutamine-hydrolyzing) [Brumimicrobium sp.]
MCGIAGIRSFNKTVEKHQLETLSTAIAHRGNDASGIFLNETKSCGLAHRRLSIIDLSDQANQPLVSPCGNYRLVFNGEIYNYESLRDELEKNGVNFTTVSDTEVVLQAFIHWGEKCVDHFNGMFAFAVWDEKSNVMSLFRDRLGIKPLYYFWDKEVFAFASEMKALTQFVDESKLNATAIHHYFRLGYIPEPYTIYEGIHKFPKGNRATVKSNEFSIKSYWNINDNIKAKTLKDFSKAKTEYHSKLKESVRIRLKSDVPFGVFLSGGIDSSTVAAIAQSQSKEKIKTFSIGFKNTRFNESEWAQKVADHLDTEHYEYILSEKDALSLIEKIPSWYDEPYADASAIPTYLVAKMANESVKMVLTGDGGDEQFMGYGMYNWAKRLSNPFIKGLKSPIALGLGLTGKNNLKRASEYFKFDSDTAIQPHIFSVDQYLFSERETKEFFNFNKVYKELKLQKTNRKLSSHEKQALFDLNYYLTDDLLTKVDRVTMQNGVEARVPLLDHNLVEFTLNLDESLKVKKGVSKYLLKEVLYDYVPKALFDRPKWGFGIPLGKWLANELKPLLDKYVNEEVLTKAKIYKVNQIMQLKERYLNGEEYLYNKLWLVIVFNMWLSEGTTPFQKS